MQRAWQAAIFLVVVIIIFLISQLPARFVYQHIAKYIPVHVQGVSGSVWAGKARTLEFGTLSLHALSWELSPLALLKGELQIDWTLGDPVMRFDGSLSLALNQVHITHTRGRIDALALTQQLPDQAMVAGGFLEVDIEEITVGRKKFLSAKGVVTWTMASLYSPQTVTLGGFKGELGIDGDRLAMQLRNTGEIIYLDGNASLSRQGAVNYVMQLGVLDITVPGLLDGFNQLGQPDQNGYITLLGGINFF